MKVGAVFGLPYFLFIYCVSYREKIIKKDLTANKCIYII